MDEIPEIYVKFWSAADELEASGKKASQRSVLVMAGGGSMRDVSRALEIRRQRTQPLAHVPAVAPESLIEGVQQLWNAAHTQAMSCVTAERTAMAAAIAGSEAKAEELREMAELFEGERDAARTQLDVATAERDTALERVRALEAEVASLNGLCETGLKRLFERAKADTPKRAVPKKNVGHIVL